MRTLLFVIVFLSLGHTTSADDFNTRLVLKLSEMLKVEPPKTIRIQILSQSQIQNVYKNHMVAECTKGDLTRFISCVQQVTGSDIFVYGLWHKEDPTTLHIQLYEKAGVESLVHEFLHWYLDGLGLNHHEVLEPMVKVILTSKEFVSWLEKEER